MRALLLQLVLLIPLLLDSSAVVVALGNCRGSSSAASAWPPQPKLQQVENWQTDPEGIPERTDVFCTGSLGSITTPTIRASQVIQAICNLKGDVYFSNSAIDTFMAGRFGSISGMWDGGKGPSRKPYSTEKNTPWMLADYVITVFKAQSRADSWKAVRAEAQVDLLLCSDEKCAVVVDLQNIVGIVPPSQSQQGGTPAAEQTPGSVMLAMVFSGLSSTFRVGSVATVREDMTSWFSGPTVKLLSEWQLGRASSTQALPIYGESQPNIHQVSWHVPKTKVLNRRFSNGSDHFGPFQRYEGIGLMSLKALASLQLAQQLPSLRYGHYFARKVLPSGTDDDVFLSWSMHGCVTIIWPWNAWMEQHQWGSSDPYCERAFEAGRWEADGGPPAVLFDSYFPQAHVLGNARLKVQHTLDYVTDHDDKVVGDNNDVYLTLNYFKTSAGAHVTNMTFAQVFALQGPGSSNLQARVDEVQYDFKTHYSEHAGRYSLTLDWTDSTQIANQAPGFVTHQAASCVKVCNDRLWPRRNCGYCAVLAVGTATIAVQPVSGLATAGEDRWLRAFSKLQRYAAITKSSELPWCASLTTPWSSKGQSGDEPVESVTVGIQEGVANPAVSVLVPELAPWPTSSFEGLINISGFGRDGGLHGEVQRPFQFSSSVASSSIVQNCSFWDSIGVAFAHSASMENVSNQGLSAGPGQPHGAAEFKLTQYWDNITRDDADPYTDGFAGYHLNTEAFAGYPLNTVALNAAIQNVVKEAARLLELHASQDLSTTDSTKTWEGALLDLSTTVVAIVAMASGRLDMEAWLFAALGKLLFCKVAVRSRQSRVFVARALACLLVLLGLIVAPAFIVHAERISRDEDTSCMTSKVGMLAAELPKTPHLGGPLGRPYKGRPYDDGPYIVVAAVTVRVEVAHDTTAFILELVNLGLACLAAFFICLDVFTSAAKNRRALLRQVCFQPKRAAQGHQQPAAAVQPTLAAAAGVDIVPV